MENRIIRERDFQSKIIKRLAVDFPGCVVIKNDPSYIQGAPDLIVLKDNKWACLECKRSSSSHIQPNQEYWVNKLNSMSFASFIYPENEEEVFDGLQKLFSFRR